MATFDNSSDYRFIFVNHSNTPIQYDLSQSAGQNIHGNVDPGQRVEQSFYHNGTLEQGNVPVVAIQGVPAPGVRFWSGWDWLKKNQYINLLEGDGYAVTRDENGISQVTGYGFTVTVDGGGLDQNNGNIFFQVYNA